jgi:DNA-binding MarR family transcriptional regulator
MREKHMAKKEWTFLSNHGRVLAYVTKRPKSTAQVIAQEVGLSIRGVQQILDELEEEGYVERQKLGRCNQYVVHLEMPMRHRLERKHCVGQILLAIGAIPKGGE